jgi:hypothetical protein
MPLVPSTVGLEVSYHLPLMKLGETLPSSVLVQQRRRLRVLFPFL